MKTFHYKGNTYFEFQKHGFASRFVFPVAVEFCVGNGYDVGCGCKEWAFPGAISIEKRDGQDAMNLPAGEVDYIFSSHCLEHLDNWVSALEHWYTRIRIGGVIFLYLPHYRHAYWRPWENRKHIHALTAEMVQDCLENMGCSAWTSGPDLNDSFCVVAEKV